MSDLKWTFDALVWVQSDPTLLAEAGKRAAAISGVDVDMQMWGRAKVWRDADGTEYLVTHARMRAQDVAELASACRLVAGPTATYAPVEGWADVTSEAATVGGEMVAGYAYSAGRHGHMGPQARLAELGLERVIPEDPLDMEGA